MALELGIRRNLLYKWQKELAKGKGAFRGAGRKPLDQQGELERLKSELRKVAEERAYIEVFYNRQRRHQTLGNLSPMQFGHATTLGRVN